MKYEERKMNNALDGIVDNCINEEEKEKYSLSFLPSLEFTKEYLRIRNALKPHEILGIPEGAIPQQVEVAYRRLVKILHPDKLDSSWQELANAAMCKINQAREYYEARN